MTTLEAIYSSCLEWRYTYPLLEDAGLDIWALDILGWGFSDLGTPFFPEKLSAPSICFYLFPF